MDDNPFVGSWVYRSLLNDPDIEKPFNDLRLAAAIIRIDDAPFNVLTGEIGGPGWSLALQGSREYGTPMRARFQGKGVIGGEKWEYDYDGYLVPHWPNGVDQRPAMVGSLIRTLTHSGGQPGTVRPAGVVYSFYAVLED